jgi:CRISPR-associated protein Csb1
MTLTTITLELLTKASLPGGASCLTSVTELEPAAGAQASVAPAKFASTDKNDMKGEYAYERRFLDGVPRDAVLIDSKQSQLNRCEITLAQAVSDQHPTLSRVPRIEVVYTRNGATEVYSDLTLPHRVYDGHIRAGTVDGTPVTQLDQYRNIRNATPANARALLDASPVSLIFGCWDSSRATRQGRWRSALVGEIIGFCADRRPALRGGARVDPVGMQVLLGENEFKVIADAQRAELTGKTYDKAVKAAKPARNEKAKREAASASMLGLGGIPPTLDSLGGVACERIIRSHVLSFATLRQLRFGANPRATRRAARCSRRWR